VYSKTHGKVLGDLKFTYHASILENDLEYKKEYVIDCEKASQDDARFKDLVVFWLFDEPFFNVCFAYFYYFRLFTDCLFFITVLITDYFLKRLEVQRYKTEQAQLAAAEKLSADAAIVKVIFLSILFLLFIFI
jgi:hypothetical protein